MISTLDFICIRINNSIPQVLLRHRDEKGEPFYNAYGLIGGMVWERPIEGSNVVDETLEGAATRILKNKIKVDFVPSYKEQLIDVGSSDRDPRGWSKTTPYICLFRNDDTIMLDKNKSLRWVDLKDILEDKINLPFDHNFLIKKAYEYLITKARYSSILFYLLDEKFIIKDVLNCFKCFNINLTKQTVMKRWVDKNLIHETGEKYQNKKGGKPASIYNLSDDNLHYFEFSISS
jgi:8-oxo-dGTP diphosphatase